MTYTLLKVIKLKTGKYKYKVILFNNSRQKEKEIFFGANGYMDYTLYYKEDREKAQIHKKAYIARHSKSNEDWSVTGIETAGFWARWLLWNQPTIKKSLIDIKQKFKKII